MSILSSRVVIHFKNELNVQDVNDFRSLLDKIETHFINKAFDKEIKVGQLTFPVNGRPRTMCRWYISSKTILSPNMFQYKSDLDDNVYNEADLIGEMVAWLNYLIQHFFIPKEIILNGEMELGTFTDILCGVVLIKDNRVQKSIWIKK